MGKWIALVLIAAGIAFWLSSQRSAESGRGSADESMGNSIAMFLLGVALVAGGAVWLAVLAFAHL